MTNLEREMERDATPTEDRLDKLRDLVRTYRDIGAEIEDLEQRLESLSSRRKAIETRSLPDMFAEAGVDRISIVAEGNLPAYDAFLQDFVRASIPKTWDLERREQAFQTLERLGLDGLIRSQVAVDFTKDEIAEAQKLVRRLIDLGLAPQLYRQVNHNSLAAALRELLDHDRAIKQSDLDAIGAFVGKIVRLKPRSE